VNELLWIYGYVFMAIFTGALWYVTIQVISNAKPPYPPFQPLTTAIVAGTCWPFMLPVWLAFTVYEKVHGL